MRLADVVGLHAAVADRVWLPGDTGSNPAGKVTTIVAGMLAGADSIDDLNVARHGGRFSANDAWLTCAAIAHNLTRAAGHLAGSAYRAARPATIRTRLITVAARIAHRARTIHLHLPEHWPWQNAFDNLFTAAHAPPI
jgi:hypothetical protein